MTDRHGIGRRADLVQDPHLEHKQVVEQDARVALPRHMAQTNLAHPKITLHMILAALHANANANACSFQGARSHLLMLITLCSVTEHNKA